MINIILSDFLEYHLNIYICICIAVEKMAKWNLLQDFFHISGQRFETDFRLFEHARSILKALKLNDDEKALKDLVLAVDVSYIYIYNACMCRYIYIYIIWFCFLFKYVFMHFWNYSGCWKSQSSGMVFSLGRRPFRGCTILGHWVPWVISAPIRTVRTCRCYWLVYIYTYIFVKIHTY